MIIDIVNFDILMYNLRISNNGHVSVDTSVEIAIYTKNADQIRFIESLCVQTMREIEAASENINRNELNPDTVLRYYKAVSDFVDIQKDWHKDYRTAIEHCEKVGITALF